MLLAKTLVAKNIGETYTKRVQVSHWLGLVKQYMGAIHNTTVFNQP